MIHTFLANYYRVSQQENTTTQQKQWYETLGGLILLSVGLNVISAFIYEQGKNSLFAKVNRKERRRERLHLMRDYGKTASEAAAEETIENNELDRAEQENSPL